MHNEALDAFFVKFIYLEPLNLFMYTWYFLRNFEQEETNTCLKKFYKWFAFVSISLLPICYVITLSVFCYEYGLVLNYSQELQVDEVKLHTKIRNNLLKTIDGLGVLTNSISCSILIVTIIKVHKFSKTAGEGIEDGAVKQKLDFVQIFAHIIITVVYTIS